MTMVKTLTYNKYVRKFGPWNSHSVEYESGKYTFGNQGSAKWLQTRGDTYSILMELFVRKPIAECRVLDVGCFEGGLSYHIAKHGADVVGLEIRDEPLGRCDFLKHIFPDLRLNFIKGNMLELGKLDIGTFDAILMAGTLYHVDAPDIMPVLKSLRNLTTGAVVIDTHIAAKVLESYTDTKTGLTLYGRSLIEHNEVDDQAVKAQRPRTAFTNNFSFWPTERSLVNAITTVGFDWCVKPMSPNVPWPFADRDVWVAGVSKGLRVKVESRKLSDPDPRPTDHKMFHTPTHAQRKNPTTHRL